MADSSAYRPHPVDYFEESWYSVSVAYWRYNWKPVYRMTDGICSLCLGHPRKGSPASPVSWQEWPQGRAGTLHLAIHRMCLPPQIPPRWLTLPSLAKEIPFGENLLALCVSLAIEIDWVCGVTSLSLGIWRAVGHAKEKFRAIISLLKVKVLLLSGQMGGFFFHLPSPQHVYVAWLQIILMLQI